MKGALTHWALTLYQAHFQFWASIHLLNPLNSPEGLICFPIPGFPGPMFNESSSVSTNSPSFPCSDPTEFLTPLLACLLGQEAHSLRAILSKVLCP